MAKKSGGIFSTILLLGVAAVLYVMFMKDAPEAADTRLLQPRSALDFYLRAAWDHAHSDTNIHLSALERVVRPEDYQWFLANYESLFSDPLRLSAASDPTGMTATKKNIVMTNIVNLGPNRPDAQVLQEKIGPDVAVFTLRYIIDHQTDTYGIADVELVKMGKTWRVVDFAGGRAMIEGRGKPVRHVIGTGPQATPTPSPGSMGPARF